MLFVVVVEKRLELESALALTLLAYRVAYAREQDGVGDDEQRERNELHEDGDEPEVDELVEVKVGIEVGLDELGPRGVHRRVPLVGDLVLEEGGKGEREGEADGPRDDLARLARPTPLERHERILDGYVALEREHEQQVDARVAAEVAQRIEDQIEERTQIGAHDVRIHDLHVVDEAAHQVDRVEERDGGHVLCLRGASHFFFEEYDESEQVGELAECDGQMHEHVLEQKAHLAREQADLVRCSRRHLSLVLVEFFFFFFFFLL